MSTRHEVFVLIEQMQPKYQSQPAAFQQRLNPIYEQYSQRSGLLRRLQEAGLPSA